jgi:outer membrane protein TolC
MTRFRPYAACGLLLLVAVAPALAGPLIPVQPTMPMPDKGVVTIGKEIVDLTLADAVFLGLRNNRAIHGAYLERTAQKFELKVAKDRFSPQISIKSQHTATQNQDDRFNQTEVSPTATLLSPYGTRVNLSWNNQIVKADDGSFNRNDGASVTVVQPLLRGAGRDVATASLQLAHLTEQANRLNLKATVASTITQIITAYHELLRTQEQLRIASEALAHSRELLARSRESLEMEINKALDDIGTTDEYEAMQIETDIAAQELMAEEATNQLEASRLRLLRLLALDLGARIRAADALDIRRTEISREHALNTAREQQPAYQTQLIAARQAAIKLVVARDDERWDVSLVGGASQVRDYRQGPDGGSRTDHNWENRAGIQVDIPIGDMSRRQAVVRARVNAKNEDIRMAEARQALEREVGDAVRTLDTRWRQFEIAQRALVLSRHKLETEREKLESGFSSSFRVLTSESDLHHIEIARLNALIAYRNAKAALDQTLGTTLDSWEVDLND